MKSVLFGSLLVAITFIGNASAKASTLNFTYHGVYNGYTEVFTGEANVASGLINKYLTTKLGCSNVSVDLIIVARNEDSEKGLFDLKASASCPSSISKFNFKYIPPTDWEDYSELIINHANNYSNVSKNYKWNFGGRVYEDREI